MIDQNRDGFIDKEDLHDMLASMGKNPTDEYLEGMMSEAPGPINFTMFLTMFGEKLNGTDPAAAILRACRTVGAVRRFDAAPLTYTEADWQP